MQSKFLIANHHGVAGVIATLVAHHVVHAIAQEVCGFTLTLVAPLGSNQNNCRQSLTPFNLGDTAPKRHFESLLEDVLGYPTVHGDGGGGRSID